MVKAPAATLQGAALALASSLSFAAVPAPDFVIDAANRVGPVTPFTSELDLLEIFGSNAVKRGQLNLGGAPCEGTILFPGTDREALIRWRGAFESPQAIKISEPSTPWITMEGVSVGTTLEDLELINGRPFVIASYDLNAGARTLSWEGGAFPSELVFDLGAQEKPTGEEMKGIRGHMTHLSSDPLIRRLRFRVRAINVIW